jgi:E3 ubiquitin-protein ligase DOA10
MLPGTVALFKLLIWSYFNFGRWYVFRISSISFRLYSLMGYKVLKYVLMILWISSVYCEFPPFISYFISLDLLFPFFINLVKGLY